VVVPVATNFFHCHTKSRSHDSIHIAADGKFEAVPSSCYVDQGKIYNDLGVALFNNCFQGYNSTILAYGQSGSGKNYTMVGYGANEGMIPLAFQQLYRLNNESQDIEVAITMVEIYKDEVRDLLYDKAQVKIRSSPAGVVLEGATMQPCPTLEDFEIAFLRYAVVHKYAKSSFKAPRTV
jgi:hypothetical protein